MTSPLRPRPIVIDTDPGIDDALALMLALRSPEVQVVALMTVAGNVPVTWGTANTHRLLTLLKPNVRPPVIQGAARPWRRPLFTATTVHAEDGLGGITVLRHHDGSFLYPLPASPRSQRNATRRLLSLVQHYGEALTIIALGPLTNIARAIRQAPEIMQRLGRLIIMGGAVSVPGNVSPVAEFNIFVDPQAADVVMRSGLQLLLVPLDVTQQVRLTEKDVAAAGKGSLLAQAVRHMTRQIMQRQPEGMALHDPLAVAVALDTSLVSCSRLPLYVETRGTHTLGMTVVDRRPPRRWATAMPQMDIALQVDAVRVVELFASRVLR